MPLATMASAAARTALSSTLPAKRFQLFQPMGGVSARFLSWAAKGSANAKQHPTTNRYPDILDFTFVLPFNPLRSKGKLSFRRTPRQDVRRKRRRAYFGRV